MDGQKFDDLLKRMCTIRLTRGSALRGLVAGAAAALTGVTLASDEADAKKKKSAAKKKGGAKNKKGKAKGRSGGKTGKQPQSKQRAQAQSATDYGCGADKVALCHNSTSNGGNIICPDASSADLAGHCGHKDDGANPFDCYCSNGGFVPGVNCAGFSPQLKACGFCDTESNNCQFECDADLCPQPDPDDRCNEAVCIDNACAIQATNNGGTCGASAPVCQQRVCRNGSCTLENIGTDSRCVIAGLNECQVAACVSGACVAAPTNTGGACTYDGTVPDCQEAVCNANGACVLRTDEDEIGDSCDDAGTPPQCQTSVCGSGDNAGTCIFVGDASQNGNACTYDGTVPDCQEAVCSAGSCVLQADADQVGDTCDFDGTVPICQESVCNAAGACVLQADAEQEGDSCSLPNPVICVHGICESGTCAPYNDPNDTACGANGEDICCTPQGSTTVVCVNDDCAECRVFDEDTCTCVGVGGCTLTQGYWKNHTEDWPTGEGVPAPGDPFFNSGTSYLGALQASSKEGNGYYALAQQYIAAVLNVATGACVPAAVTQAIADAEALFAAATGSSFDKSQKTVVTALIQTLTNYNEGVTGPGHCG